MPTIIENVQITGALTDEYRRALTPEALAFVARLEREFRATRAALLRRRAERQAELDAGVLPGFPTATAQVRAAEWRVASAPADLQDRRVEITGPVERKMMINAFNSGARVFMADFEDALSPTWSNVAGGQVNLIDAVRRELAFTSPEGKRYELKAEIATLVVRPRGWHLVEKHVHLDGAPVSASLFDFGVFFFHNARALLERGSGPYFYLPKLESHLEARLWNDVFHAAQDALGLPRGTIRVTVLIETILAALEMEEILYELRDHIVALNAGRWDYIFSIIKKFRSRPDFVLPDRAQVTMTVPFMRAYTTRLVEVCHRRGAHALGGMAAFIPSRKDPAVNEVALAKVREDKEREASDGFDGTWVAHPDLVPVAGAVFDRVLGERPHQKEQPGQAGTTAAELLDVRVPGGSITEAGAANNISVAVQYLAAWLGGSGAVGIFNLMEDTATAEIARAQLWQWLRTGVTLEDGHPFGAARYATVRDRELTKLSAPEFAPRPQEAAELLDRLVLEDRFQEFLTLPAYERLE